MQNSIKLNNRRFGVEFEFTTKYEKLEKLLSVIIPKKLLKCTPNSDKSDGIKWHLKLDYTTESELCTPILTYKNQKNIEQILKYLRENNVRTTKKDSLHFHFDVSDIKPDQLLSTWLYVEVFIINLFPEYRRKGSYACPYIKNPSKTKILANYYKQAKEISYGHHQVFSLENYADRKTIEIRISEGTVNYIHFQNWLLLCLHILSYAKHTIAFENLLKPIILKNEISKFMSEFNIKTPHLINWIQSRNAKYG